jgi:2',3'-cyclic-nucleotide 2'-phosphodiesterase (5'-nucleotidase family)
MARWASLIDKRRTMHPSVLLDAGSFSLPFNGDYAELVNRYFFEGMKLFGYAAAGIGSEEIKYGPDSIKREARRAGFTLLSSNIYERPDGGHLGTKYKIIRAGGRKTLFGERGGIKIGVFSVVTPTYIYDISDKMNEYYDVISPRIAALEAVTALSNEGCDLIVALSYQNWNSSVNLASTVEGIDLVISGRQQTAGIKQEKVGDTWVVDTGDKRTTLTEVVVEWIGGKPKIKARNAGDEAHKMEPRADLAELEARYQRERKALGIAEQEEEDSE